LIRRRRSGGGGGGGSTSANVIKHVLRAIDAHNGLVVALCNYPQVVLAHDRIGALCGVGQATYDNSCYRSVGTGKVLWTDSRGKDAAIFCKFLVAHQKSNVSSAESDGIGSQISLPKLLPLVASPTYNRHGTYIVFANLVVAILRNTNRQVAHGGCEFIGQELLKFRLLFQE